MAISYETLLPDVLPHVNGCIDTLAENNIKAAVIELCERAGIYRQELDPITAVGDRYEYDFDAPNGTSVHRIEWVTYEGEELEPITSSLLEQRLKNWREESGQPAYYVQQSSTSFFIAPVPASNSTSAIKVKAVLKPTYASGGCDDDVVNDYRDTIVNGALFRLLRMPAKEWTDMNAAGVYGSLFNEGVLRAEQEARGANVGVSRKVNYGGIGNSRSGSWRSRTRDYGNKW